ncbi:MAG TPA: hypothetical protein VF527_21330 [Pyrinomonadaceae bacterium]
MRKTINTLPLQLIAVALFFCLPVAAQKGKRAPQKRPAGGVVVGEVIREPDAGQVVGSTYTNAFFGLQLTIPEGWRVADEAATRQIDQQGADLIAGDSEEKRAQLKAAASKTSNLLTMGKVISVGGATESAVLIFGAEAVPVWLIKTPQEYIGQARRLLQTSAMPVKVEEGTRSETIGGVEFSVLDVSSEQPGGIVRQHYYATLRKGYALFIISTFASNQGTEAIGEVLKSVKFK